MAKDVVEEFMTVGDYPKIYDFLSLSKKEFLNSYNYINEKSYDLSYKVAMKPSYIANLFRQAENLLVLEQEKDIEEISYMQEVGTNYIYSHQWKDVAHYFVLENYTMKQQKELEEICESMGI